MAKPIKMTEELLDKATEEFRKQMASYKSSDGKINYEVKLPTENEKAEVIFDPIAYIKMRELVRVVTDEVAWHGIAERQDDNKYFIKDIIIYPQIVSSATVNTDDDDYPAWKNGLDDDIYNNLRMQGHSHVTFPAEPSTTDTANQKDFLSQLTSDDFYVFIIWNKRNEHWCKIYDMAKNIMFENQDITVSIYGQDIDIDEFIQESKKVIKKEPKKTTTYTSYSKGATTPATTSTNTTTKTVTPVSAAPVKKYVKTMTNS